jgi:hypothetical protein
MDNSFARQLRPCADISRFRELPPWAKAESAPLTTPALRADLTPVCNLERNTTGDSLKWLLAYESSAESRRLHNSLTDAERGARCILRAMSLASYLFILSLAALAYCAALLPDFLSNRAHFIINSLSFVCLASFISAIEFLGCRLRHRISVNRLHHERHRLLLPLYESHLIPPQDTAPAMPPIGKLQRCPWSAKEVST